MSDGEPTTCENCGAPLPDNGERVKAGVVEVRPAQQRLDLPGSGGTHRFCSVECMNRFFGDAGVSGLRKAHLNLSALLTEDLIPRKYFFKKSLPQNGTRLSEFLSEKSVSYEKSYEDNNVSGSNITERDSIPGSADVSNFKLAVCRIGNSSVGRAGLINVEKDVLNDMFYVFGFKRRFRNDRLVKERVCERVNKLQEVVKGLASGVGSKSIRKDELLNLVVEVNGEFDLSGLLRNTCPIHGEDCGK